jgi:hypothetical protein
MDSHISTLDFSVINEKGRITKEKRVRTSVKEFIEFVSSVPCPRKVIMEEGTLSSWFLKKGSSPLLTALREKNRLILWYDH